VIEEVVAVLLEQAGPTVLVGNLAGLVVWCFRALVRHLEKQQVRQLLNVVTVAHPVVAENVAVVPEFLDDGRGTHTDGHDVWTREETETIANGGFTRRRFYAVV